jgi:hypothetical protein
MPSPSWRRCAKSGAIRRLHEPGARKAPRPRMRGGAPDGAARPQQALPLPAPERHVPGEQAHRPSSETPLEGEDLLDREELPQQLPQRVVGKVLAMGRVAVETLAPQHTPPPVKAVGTLKRSSRDAEREACDAPARGAGAPSWQSQRPGSRRKPAELAARVDLPQLERLALARQLRVEKIPETVAEQVRP